MTSLPAWRGAALGLAACLAACTPAPAPQPPAPAVEVVAEEPLPAFLLGSATYHERVALPADAELRVAVFEARDTDVTGRLVAQQVLRPNLQVPIAFALRLEPAAIDPRRLYLVEAQIVRGGRTLYTTVAPAPVLTRRNPRRADLVLVPAGRG